MAKRDYYDVLGVSKDAREADVKRAYRRLAKQHHPDQNKGDKDSEAKFKEVQEAYDVLSDEQKRGRYDRFGHAGIDRSSGPGVGAGSWSTPEGQVVDLGDLADLFDFGSPSGRGGAGRGGGGSIFEQLFRGARAGPGTRVPEAPVARDIEHRLTLTFEQAIRGTTLDLCLETGRGRSQRISVTIPAGVRHGQRIRVRGKGQPGSRGSPPGDLYVVCAVQLHAFFERRGDDIYLDVPLTIAEASLGAKVDLPTLDGIRTVTVPPGTASGAKLRLGGLGVPSPKGGERGDQYAVIKIIPPTELTNDQERLLEKLAESGIGSPREGLWP